MVACTTCVNNVMNANEKLTLETTCDNCGDNASALTYEWNVYRVIDEKYNFYYGAHDYGRCVEANGSSYLNMKANDTEENTTSTSTTNTAQQPTTTTAKPTLPPPKMPPIYEGPGM